MSEPSFRIRGTTPQIDSVAIELRQNLTPAEKTLWQALRGGKLGGLKFRRQHPVGKFILDFYCPACQLVIEVDGAIHDAQMEYDAARTDTLTAHGYTVLRFQNEAVINNLETVLEKIIQTAIAISPNLSLDLLSSPKRMGENSVECAAKPSEDKSLA